MNAIQKFLFEEHQIRVIERFDEPWFVAVDVCKALALHNQRQVVSALDDDEKGVQIMDTPGGQQKMNIISLPGLFALVSKSRKPVARAFDRWVRHVVLVQIAKTGKFVPDGYVEEHSFSANETASEPMRFLELLASIDDNRLAVMQAYMNGRAPVSQHPAVRYDRPKVPDDARELLSRILDYSTQAGYSVRTMLNAAWSQGETIDLRPYGIVMAKDGIFCALARQWYAQLKSDRKWTSHLPNLWKIPGCYGGGMMKFADAKRPASPTVFVPRAMLGID